MNRCDIPELPELVNWADIQARYDVQQPLKIPIGIGGAGEDGFVNLNLGLERTSHIMIGGSTGRGKTNLCHSIICSLLHADPGRVQLLLFDFNYDLEFKEYYKRMVPHMISVDTYHLVRIMNNRLASFFDTKAKDKEIIIVANALEKAERISFTNLAQIARHGHYAGMHLIVCMQRIDRLIKLSRDLFPIRIAFQCATHKQSMQIIGYPDAYDQLDGKLGRAIMRYSLFRFPFQAALVTAEDRQMAIEHALRVPREQS